MFIVFIIILWKNEVAGCRAPDFLVVYFFAYVGSLSRFSLDNEEVRITQENLERKKLSLASLFFSCAYRFTRLFVRLLVCWLVCSFVGPLCHTSPRPECRSSIMVGQERFAARYLAGPARLGKIRTYARKRGAGGRHCRRIVIGLIMTMD